MRRTTCTAALLMLMAAWAVPGAVRAQEEEPAEEDVEKEVRERRIVLGGLPGMRWAGMGARHGYLGVGVDDVDRESAGELGLDEVRGARITEVSDGSPADEAGLREDDVIVRFNEEAVESVAELVRLVGETPPGREVSLGVVRAGSEQRLSLEVGRRPGWEWDEDRMERVRERAARAMERRGVAMERLRRHMEEGDFDWDVEIGDGEGHVFFLGGRGRLGVRLQSLTDQLAGYFGVEDRGGALITSVEDDSPAAAAGLRAGDVIVRIGDRGVEDPGDAASAVREAGAGPVTVTFVREGEERTVTAELPERDAPRSGFRCGEGEDCARGYGPVAAPRVAPVPPVRLFGSPAPRAVRVRADGGLPEPPRVQVRAPELPETGLEELEEPAPLVSPETAPPPPPARPAPVLPAPPRLVTI